MNTSTSNTPKHDTVVLMFAKYPAPGNVKTRIAATAGDDTAVAAYQEFLHTLIKAHTDQSYDFVVCLKEADKVETFSQEFSHDHIQVQIDSPDLGERITHAITENIPQYKKVIVISSDTPELNHTHIGAAKIDLDAHDAVIGPAYDGGYFLIGMKTFIDVFSGINWSTDAVYKETCDKLDAADASYTFLDHLHDIDTEMDLEAYRERQAVTEKASA